MSTGTFDRHASRLCPEHQNYLRERAIPFDLASQFCATIGAETMASILGFPVPHGSYALAVGYPGVSPYYARVRTPDKWLAPKGREVPAFVPFLLRDNEPIYVVEAPTKALARAALGLNVVGLGGVATTLEKDKTGAWSCPNFVDTYA